MNTGLEQSDELLIGFIDESLDALRELAVQLNEYRQDPSVADPINAVFRAVHSIKGNAGFFGLTAIKKFSHTLENTLDDIRNGKLTLVEDLERAFVEGFDLLDEMLQHVLEGETVEELGSQEMELLERVGKLANEHRAAPSEEERLLAEALALAEEIAAATFEQSADWARRVRLLIPGESTQNDEGGHAESDGQAEQSCEPVDLAGRTFTVDGQDVTEWVNGLLDLFLVVNRGDFTDAVGAKFIEAAETFAAWAASSNQSALAVALNDARGDLQTILDSPLDIDETLLSIIWDHLRPQLALLTSEAEASQAPPKEEQQQTAQAEPSAEEALGSKEKAPSQASQKGGAKTRFLRVKEECVDGFMDDVSSLFITAERLKDVHNRMTQASDMQVLVEELRQINATFVAQTNNLQQSVVVLRKVPVRGLFSKFPRVARSLAAKLGKKLNVHLVGEENEIDKSLAEDLDAPLMHMVRNVCDHAVETPEERIERGVNEDGNLWLKCELTRSHVVLTIQDDGRGIDGDRLRIKAVEKGVLTQTQADLLTNQESIDLIFHPGFSTAEKVTDVSGRGVGMDVVRTKLREHDGDVRVQSQVGVGTTFHLEIPVRQAVLVVDSLLLKHDDADYVLPLDSIREIVELEKTDLKTVQGSRVASIRGEPYSAVSLGQMLDGDTREVGDGEKTEGVLIGCKEGTMCLLVDRILGQRKVVVNSLGDILPCTEKMAGVAQLGAGRLALVLSAPDLIKSIRPEHSEAVEA